MTIPIAEIRDNDVLNEAVKEKNGSIILPKGTVLKREYIGLLDELKVETVSVDKPGGILKEDTGQRIVERIRKLYETHIYQNRARLAEFTKITEEAIENFKQRRLLDDVSGQEDMYEEIYLTAAMSYEMAENRGFSDKQLFDMVLGVMLSVRDTWFFPSEGALIWQCCPEKK